MLAAEDVGLALLLAWTFYDAYWMAIVLLAPVVFFNGRRYWEKQSQQREKQFIAEYKEMLKNLISGLEAGYSVENAFAEAERQHRQLFPEQSVLAAELHAINAATALRTPIERAFGEFAGRFPYEEVLGFAEIFSFGKRLGGNYVENLRTTARKLEEKVELKQEIAATFAEKRLELSVMSVMPMGIVVYMKLGSPEFLAPMYHNVLGITVMSGCIAVYLGAILLGKRIVEIEI
ncbi:MAG: type II secretion system F family protein [Lachnospiraceae bacterium]|nr:type II secretion system F family protein [Lachnospiraceae bacterium]